MLIKKKILLKNKMKKSLVKL